MKTSSTKEEANIQLPLNSAQDNVSKDKADVGTKNTASNAKAKKPNYRRLL